MRNFKFRAWDKKQKVMIDPFYLVDDIFTAKKHLFFPSTSGGIDFQQYTGLKDKNDVEIYEGDILQWDSVGEYSLVEFVNFRFSHKFGDETKRLKNRDSKECLVIGNIFENSELLND